MNSFLEEVAIDIHQKLGNRLKDSALVFVNKRPLVYMMDYLGKLQSGPGWAPQMFTIQEFFNLSTELKIADPITQFFYLWKAYQQILPPEERENQRMDRFYRTGLTLLSDFNSLDEELIEINPLFADLRDRALLDSQFTHMEEESLVFLRDFWASFSIEKISFQQEQFLKMWQRMPHLYEKLQELLRREGFITQGGLYRKLAESLAERPHFLEEFKEGKIIFIGFNALSEAENRLFQKWQNQGKALFYFDTDPYYLEDKLQEAGKFLRKNLGHSGLINSYKGTEEKIQSRNKIIKVYQIQGQTAQAKVLPQILKPYLEKIVQKGDYRKIALVLADESLLVPVLQSIPGYFPDEQNPIPVNITMGYGLKNSTLFGLIEAWAQVQENLQNRSTSLIYYKDFQIFLNHPFFPILETDRDQFLGQMIQGQKIYIPISDILEKFPEAQYYFQKANNGVDGLQKLLALLHFILESEFSVIAAMEEELGWASVNEINKLLDSFLEFGEDLSVSLTLSLVKKSLSTLSIPLAGEPLEGIQIMGLLETRSLDFETIFMLGVSDSFVPKAAKKESFIPDSLRKAHGLTVQEDQDALAAYIFYRLFQKGKNIHLLYNAQNSESNSGEPSRFIRQMEFESGHLFKTFSYSPDFQSAKPKKILVKKEGAVWASLLKFFVPDRANKTPLSATGLTTYLQCSLQFYYKYLAEIQEPVQMIESIQDNVLGSILHSVMQSFYLGFLEEGKEIKAEDIKENKKRISTIIYEVYRDYLGLEKEAAPLKISGKVRLSLEVVKRYAEKILDWDEQYSPFILRQLENKNFLIPFWVNILGEDKSILIKGIIDRLDERNGITRIIDYKTGKDELKFHSLEEVFRRDTKKPNKALFQTLFYTMIAEKILNINAIEPHLYRVRKMDKEKPESTLFYQSLREEVIDLSNKNKTVNKTILLQGEELAKTKLEFEKLLKNTLEEIFNPEIPFVQTQILKNCTYCPYKIPCGR